MKKILITGGCGFIGSHLAEKLQHDAEVLVLDNLRTGRLRNLDGIRARCIRGSILDRALLRETLRGVRHVYHLAAMISVPESVGDPRGCVELNVNGLLNVLEESAAAGVEKLFFASSAAIYGDNPAVPKVETMLPEPRSPYAITKLDGEYYCRQFAADGRLDTVALRFFNVFGPRQDPKSAYAAAVPVFMQKALAGEPLVIYGDGGQTRDFIHVHDLAAACIHVMNTPGLTGVLNAGYGGQLTVLDLARRIIALAGSRSEIHHAPPRPGDVRHSRADTGALRATGFVPQTGLAAGLASTLDSFKAQTAAPAQP
ncbi:MAG: NAD-dependent epimerase/dehydratase family protein [Opitutaceae bacterium]|jgi:UDP-glucose 4-epimerase|nr:NAD-dependent epimerase/dehydratase family protein [Opitutaceae bacterium]